MPTPVLHRIMRSCATTCSWQLEVLFCFFNGRALFLESILTTTSVALRHMGLVAFSCVSHPPHSKFHFHPGWQLLEAARLFLTPRLSLVSVHIWALTERGSFWAHKVLMPLLLMEGACGTDKVPATSLLCFDRDCPEASHLCQNWQLPHKSESFSLRNIIFSLGKTLEREKASFPWSGTENPQE